MQVSAIAGGNRNVVLGIVAAVVFIAAGFSYFSSKAPTAGAVDVEQRDPSVEAPPPQPGGAGVPFKEKPADGDVVDLNVQQPEATGSTGAPAPTKLKRGGGAGLRPPSK